MKNRIFVVIPAYNEEDKLGQVLEKTKRYCRNIIVVDDGSQDHTFQIAKKHNVIALRHKINLGKGGALKTGCEVALDLGAEIIVLMDADGQHQPKDIPRLMRGVQEGRYEVIFGIRRLNRTMPFSMLGGNKLFSLAINCLYNFKLTDTQCGFRAFEARVYPKVCWESQGYDVETEMIINTLKSRLRCGAVYIDTIYHNKYKGTTVIDGLRILAKIIGERFLRQ